MKVDGCRFVVELAAVSPRALSSQEAAAVLVHLLALVVLLVVPFVVVD